MSRLLLTESHPPSSAGMSRSGEGTAAPDDVALPSLQKSGAADLLDERKLVTDDLTVNEAVVHAIAVHRAHRERDQMLAIGVSRNFLDCYYREEDRLRQQAQAMIATRRDRAEVETLPPHARLIRQLEFKVAKLRDGLGCPRDPHALAHYETLLAQARAAAPDDPAVALAVMLEG